MSISQRAYQNYIEERKKAWCMKHPIAFWGKDQFGDLYAKCYEGFKKNEKCEMGVNEDE